MTPKEKAIELYEKYNIFAGGLIQKMWDENTKAICMINVNEIIKSIDWHDFETPNKEIEFWEQVKEQLKTI